jgi:tetratricopeptide (TPR) repeat protein
MRTKLITTWMISSSLIAWGEPNASSNPETKVIMSEIFESIATLLPLSLNDKSFYETKNKDNIQSRLDALVVSAKKLKTHGKAQDESFRFVSRNLEQDSTDARNWFKEGRQDEARYMLHNITENCISCHTKQESKNDYPGISKFFSKVDIQQLAPIDRARLLMAMRQFDDAMNAFEEIILKGGMSPSDLIFLDAFTDYLKLTVRVKKNYDRAFQTLQKFSQSSKSPKFVQTQMEDWLSALKELSKTKVASTKDLALARQWMTKAQGQMKYPRDRDGMVYYIAASGALHAALGDAKLSGEEKSEVYYRLGFIEEVIGRSFWVSQSSNLLESAVRVSPKSKFALDAYNLLEEYVYLDYSGSSGTDIPQDIQENLGELKKLIEGK